MSHTPSPDQIMVAAFLADPDHGCTGRSAPARLARAIAHADRAGLAVPELGWQGTMARAYPQYNGVLILLDELGLDTRQITARLDGLTAALSIAEEVRDLLQAAGLVQGAVGLASQGVDARGVAIVLGPIG